ncbi:MAG: leucyl aminopeptidase family protein [Gammaproteobacteria bacterium]|nr:leucyl aminopeptidase family protein [Gammaproteobacteria bacterium]
MLECFCQIKTEQPIPITPVTEDTLDHFLAKQNPYIKNYCEQTGFSAKPNEYRLITNEKGDLIRILVGVQDIHDIWAFAFLPLNLPIAHTYYLDHTFEKKHLEQVLIAWGLGSYQFCRYKPCPRKPAQLVVPDTCDLELVENIITGIYVVRDLINTPTDDMLPANLAETVEELGQTYQALVSQIIGEDLFKKNFRGIYMVGRASHNEPRLIDLRWGDQKNPKITLVGKGVCFDTGGLNIKTMSGMSTMKKDMGGAAHAIALAQMIMRANLPVRLRLLIPAVENSISGNAYRPGDVIMMRSGKTVEVTNTDAEGRLILADALFEASNENPDLLIDFATLTSAARIALGTDIAALFSPDEKKVTQLIQLAKTIQDPIWPLPLYQPYHDFLESPVADMTNCTTDQPYGGAILAALFLQEFVSKEVPWLHFDVMAMNITSRPGRPKGGEAMALRAVFWFLQEYIEFIPNLSDQREKS